MWKFNWIKAWNYKRNILVSEKIRAIKAAAFVVKEIN